MSVKVYLSQAGTYVVLANNREMMANLSKQDLEEIYAKIGQVLQDDDLTSKSSDVVYS